MKLSDIFKIVVWQMLNPFLLKRKRNKIYHLKEHILGINIGCGLDNPENWMGVDGGITHYLSHKAPSFLLRYFYKGFNMSANYTFKEYKDKIKNIQFVHHDMLYGLPFEDNSVPNIFSSHFFEHIFKEEAEELMKECFRVLKPGGRIRICVPDLEEDVKEMKQALSAYENNDITKIQKYVTRSIVGFNGKYSNHRWMYNFDEMKSLMEKCGFKNISKQERNKGLMTDTKQLDTRDGLFVEAVK